MVKKTLIVLLWLSFFTSINLNPIQFYELNLLNKIRITLPLIFFITLLIFYTKKLNFDYQKKIIGLIFLFITLLYSYFTIQNSDNNNFNLFWPIYMMITCITVYAFTDNLDKKIILGVSLIFLFAVFVFFDLLVIKTMIERNNFHFYGMMGATYNEGSQSYVNIKNAPRPSGLARISLVLYASSCVYYLFDKTKKPIILILVVIFGTFTLLYQSRTVSFIFIFINIFMIIFYFKNYFFSKKFIIFSLILPLIFNASVQIITDPSKNNIGPMKNYLFGTLIRKQMFKTYKDENEKINRYSSGRYFNWKKSLDKIMEKPLKGYGAQADRIYIKESIHNAFLYASLSGGIISGILMFIMYLISLYYFIHFFFFQKIQEKEDISLHISIFIIIIFNLRSVLETSFAVYSIDFILFILAFSIIESNFHKKKIGK